MSIKDHQIYEQNPFLDKWVRDAKNVAESVTAVKGYQVFTRERTVTIDNALEQADKRLKSICGLGSGERKMLRYFQTNLNKEGYVEWYYVKEYNIAGLDYTNVPAAHKTLLSLLNKGIVAFRDGKHTQLWLHPAFQWQDKGVIVTYRNNLSDFDSRLQGGRAITPEEMEEELKLIHDAEERERMENSYLEQARKAQEQYSEMIEQMKEAERKRELDAAIKAKQIQELQERMKEEVRKAEEKARQEALSRPLTLTEALKGWFRSWM